MSLTSRPSIFTTFSKYKPNSTQHETSFVRRYLLPNVKPTARVQMVRVFSEISTPSNIGSSTFRGAFGDLKDEGYDDECNWIGTGAPAPFTLASHSRLFVVRIVLEQERATPLRGPVGVAGSANAGVRPFLYRWQHFSREEIRMWIAHNGR